MHGKSGEQLEVNWKPSILEEMLFHNPRLNTNLILLLFFKLPNISAVQKPQKPARQPPSKPRAHRPKIR